MGGLTFNAASHQYFVDGVELPSVTTILRAVGLIDFSGVPAHILANAQARGVRLHVAAQLLTEGTLDWDSVDVSERGYVEAYARFLAEARFVVLAQEVRLYSPTHQIAGTTDAIGWWDGRPAVADLKSGDPDAVAARYQLALYALLLRETPPVEWIDWTPSSPLMRVSIAVRRDGTYRADVYTDPRDTQVALAALAVYRAIVAQRKGRAA